MSTRTALAMATVALLSTASCQNPSAPEAVQGTRPMSAALGQQTGPNNRCYGEITSGIASTWPWAHLDKAAFAPPPGGLARWVQDFGPLVGISSVRELQVLFCS